MTRITYTKKIPQEKQGSCGWELLVNEEIVGDVQCMQLRHPKFGTLSYGMTPGGWDGWDFSEIGGGGAVTLPFYVGSSARDSCVGLIIEDRPNMGGKVLCGIGGFIKPGETHFEAAAREAAEEAGMLNVFDGLFELNGMPGNCNRAFWVTDADNGLRYYGLPVEVQGLVDLDENDETDALALSLGAMMKFDPSLVVEGSPVAQKVLQCYFFPLEVVIGIPDLIGDAGMARLISWLWENH